MPKLLVTLSAIAALGFCLMPSVSQADTFASTGSLAIPRRSHTATLLPNGNVLVAGGMININTFTSTNGAELYNPATGLWTTTGPLGTARNGHTATLLSNGKVLVVGGNGNSGLPANALANAEIYDPATGTWTATGSLAPGRSGHTATLLPNGKVLVAGGYNINVGYFTDSALYDPVTGTWTATGSLAPGRSAHTATLLPNGKVLVAGGYNGVLLASTTLYDPAIGVWTASGSLPTAHFSHTATLLPNGKVLLAGGESSGANNGQRAELYDPATGTWTATTSLATTRITHTATLLPGGKVLVAGSSNNGFLVNAELYDPASGTWFGTESLVTERNGHTATLLSNGKLLIAGGQNINGVLLASAELYDPLATFPPLLTGIFPASGSISGATTVFLTGRGFTGATAVTFGGTAATSFTVNSATLITATTPIHAAGSVNVAVATSAGTGTGTNLFTYTAPDIALEAPAGTPVTNGTGTLTYSPTAAGLTSDQALNLRNIGSASLITIAASITGPDAGQFSLVSSPPVTLASGASATFSIRFSPTSLGPKTATLFIASNDPDENPFVLALIGTSLAPPTDPGIAWQQAQFGTDAGNPLVAGPDADPDHDGVVNLLERAFNLSPLQSGAFILTSGIGTTGLPLVETTEGPYGPVLSIEFLRRKLSTNPGLTYTPQLSSSLGENAWSAATAIETVESIDANWERVTVTDTIVSAPSTRFGRVQVTASP